VLVPALVFLIGVAGAAWAVSLTSACAVLGRLAVGLVVDRMHTRGIIAGNFLPAGGLGRADAGRARRHAALTTRPNASRGNSACTITLGRLVVLPTPRPNMTQAT